MKKVKYIPNRRFYSYSTLTAGATYTVESEYTTGAYDDDNPAVRWYRVRNDRGEFYDYRAELFEEVKSISARKIDKEIAELEAKLEQLREARQRTAVKNVFYRAYEADIDTGSFEDDLDSALVTLSDNIGTNENFTEGLSLYFHIGDAENTGIALDTDYAWSIVEDGNGRCILVCKDA